ncbi:MAG: host attachment protein [Verrucomicrobiales bacterium]|nr:host attachment protein [Verrucomicrobiales bacterium]
MKNTFIVLADLGHLRAFQPQAAEPGVGREYDLKEIKLAPLTHTPTPISEQVTDQAGRFAQGGGAGAARGCGMSHGEAHNLKTEDERRLIKELASRIDAVLAKRSPARWILAAPSAILPRLKEALHPTSKKILVDTQGSDLTKLSLKQVEARFFKPIDQVA